VHRDDDWFKENIPILKKMWDYVLFYRQHEDKKKELQEYLDKLDYKSNAKIMKFIESQYNNYLDRANWEETNLASSNKIFHLHSNPEFFMTARDGL